MTVARPILAACLAALALAAASPPAGATDAARFEARIAALYDSSRGGWLAKDGRPAESAVELAFALGDGDPGSPWTARALASVGFLRTLLDTLNGGAMDRLRDVDGRGLRLEKSTVPNARRLELWLEAERVASDPRVAKEAARLADFFERVLLDGRGGFVAAQVGDRELEPEANGVAIRAWLRWGAARGDARTRDFAWKSLDRVWQTCWDADAGLLLRGPFGEIVRAPRLADQIEMGRAYALAAHFGGREGDLERARLIADRLLALYEDAERGGFRTQVMIDGKGRVRRAARLPDENARAARFLMELAVITGEARFRDAAVRAAAAFTGPEAKIGLEAADWALALRTVSIEDLPEKPRFAPPAPRTPDRRKSAIAKGSRG